MPVAKTLLWGYHPVFEALRARRRELHTVYLAGGQGAPRRQAIADAARRAGVAVQWVEPDKLTALVGHRRHQDVAAEAAAYPVSALEEIVRACPAGTAGWVLLLDQIVDPQNFGAIVRTAHCAGIHGIVAPKDRSAPPSAAASKASAGALWLEVLAGEKLLVGGVSADRRMAAGGNPGHHPGACGGHQGADDHPGGQGHSQPQRRDSPEARPLCLRATGEVYRKRAQPDEAPRKDRHGHFPGEHRGPLRRDRVAGRHPRGRAGERLSGVRDGRPCPRGPASASSPSAPPTPSGWWRGRSPSPSPTASPA
jgi:hypothetical protein